MRRASGVRLESSRFNVLKVRLRLRMAVMCWVIVLPFLIVVNVNVEAVRLARVHVVPKSELFGEVAALALGAVADVGHDFIPWFSNPTLLTNAS
jgi:hypothetical protein